MKVKLEIPIGWRRLRHGEAISKGDRFMSLKKLQWIKSIYYGANVQVGITFENVLYITKAKLKPSERTKE